MQKTVTLVITGGIAAYKSLILIRRLRDAGIKVVPVMTSGATQFVTPLSVAALAEHSVYQDLFDLKDETEMGHIRLMRDCDLVLIAPASADFMAKMTHGLADDLASTAVLASDKPIIVAPSMNAAMWAHPATQANAQTLLERGIEFWGPADGDMACGDVGTGRMLEPEDLAQQIIDRLQQNSKPLAGYRVVVTAGPTREAIDPVRYISNHSSGKQGYAIAEAFARAGADTQLITGPTRLATPPGVHRVDINSAEELMTATEASLPANIAVLCAAVGDWRVANAADEKLKKSADQNSLTLTLIKNPDILHAVGHHKNRPDLVVGFAAETQDLVGNASSKRERKNSDFILANDVSTGTDTFGGDNNRITLVDRDGATSWPKMTKAQVAQKLVQTCIDRLENNQS